jgi:PBP1b-binding outer membrane lipoprotein LpoB
MTKKRLHTFAVVLLSIMLLTGCATDNDQTKNGSTGTTSGNDSGGGKIVE